MASSSLLLGWLSWLVVHTNKGPSSNVVTAFVSSPVRGVPSTTPSVIVKSIPAPTRITTTNRRSYFHAKTTTTRLFNQPLATEGDWSAYLDENNTGFVYYFNSVTGQSLWEKPTPTFPDVNLSGEAQRRADQQKEAYLKEQQARAASAAPAKKGFFGSILETPASKETVSEPQKAKQDAAQEKSGGMWFGQPQTAAAKTKQEASTSKNDWFGPSLFADALPERPTTQKEKVDEKGKGDWFGSLFASTTSADEEKKAQTKPKKEGGGAGGLFGGMLKSAATSNGAAATTTATKEKIQVTGTATETIAPIQIQSAAYVLPHPAKVRWGGEDAVFTRGRTFGVFDGVSGAEKLDGVPLYSKTLADEMKRVLPDEDESLTMPEITKRLLQCVEIADQTATGASTAVVACIGQDGFLRALNVGDSACLVIRNNRVVAKTREISHYFECPYQLSVDSPDRPRDGTKLNVELARGDLVLMGSDGIFDNLSEKQVLEIVDKEKKNLSTLAKRVVELSRKVSLDRKAPTPYAKLAKRYGDPDFADGLGGKVDDVSCIVVRYE